MLKSNVTENNKEKGRKFEDEETKIERKISAKVSTKASYNPTIRFLFPLYVFSFIPPLS